MNIGKHDFSTASWAENMKCSVIQYQERKKNRCDKTTEEIEYQRSKQDCTFKPKLKQFKTMDGRSKQRQTLQPAKKS